MLDRQTLTRQTLRRLIQSYTALVYCVCQRVGFRGEELHDTIRDVWAALWADREKWPPGGPNNEIAFLRTVAHRTAVDKMRALKETKKRGAPTISLHALTRRDDCDPANAKDGSPFRFMVEYEERIDRAMIDHAIRVVASTLSTESEAVILSELDDGPSFGKHVRQKAMRNFRRALELPADAPYRAGVTDAADHLIKAAQRIEREAAQHFDDIELTQEVPCGTDIRANRIDRIERYLPMSAEPRRSGAPASSPTASPSSESARIPSSRACERTPSKRSSQLANASARSRRQALSGSTGATTRTPSPRAASRKPDRTVVTHRPSMLEEESSVSGSRG